MELLIRVQVELQNHLAAHPGLKVETANSIAEIIARAKSLTNPKAIDAGETAEDPSQP